MSSRAVVGIEFEVNDHGTGVEDFVEVMQKLQPALDMLMTDRTITIHLAIADAAERVIQSF